jgi:hypothetical protein
MKPRSRASDRLDGGSREAFADPDFCRACEIAIELWRCDPFMRLEFLNVVDVVDFIYSCPETLLGSLSK